MKPCITLRLLRSAAPLVLFMASCSLFRSGLQVNKNFESEVQPLQNLSFVFDKTMAPDSVTGRWDTNAIMKFEPAVRGKFKWNSGNELIFSPEEPFRPSTDYKATFTDLLFNYSEKKYQLPDGGVYEFHTPYLAQAGTQIFWAMSKTNPGAVEIRINLNFNYEVNPGAVSEKLTIEVDGKPVKHQLLSTTPDVFVGISIPDVNASGRDKLPMVIKIDKGLECIGSDYKTPEPIIEKTFVPSKLKLQISQMITSYVNGEGLISIFTTQPVTDKDLKKYISVEPKVRYRAELLENGLALRGDFVAGEVYKVTVSGKLQGVFGDYLETDYSRHVTFGETEPSLEFLSKNGVYLSSAGRREIGMHITGIPKIKLTIIKIYENNIQAFLRREEQWGYEYIDGENGDYDYYDYRYYDTEFLGDVISEKEIDATALPRSGRHSYLKIDLNEIEFNHALKGIYVIKAEDPQHRWLQQSKAICVSDIGLIAKHGRNGIHIFANSLSEATPVSGAQIKIFSTNNQQMASANTSADGTAIFDASTFPQRFTAGLITATLGGDFTYLWLPEAGVETSRFEVGGKRGNTAGYDAFIYGDRDLYRPGDTIYSNTVVRASSNRNTLKEAPLKIKLVMPNGRTMRTVNKLLNDEGAAEAVFILPPAAMTGIYTLEALNGNDVLLNSKRLSVEEFMPDRIKVKAETGNEPPVPGGFVNLSLTATNLYGPPATGKNWEAELQLSRKTFSPKDYPNYNFSIRSKDYRWLDGDFKKGSTDDNGMATAKFKLPEFTGIGLVEGRIYSTVFDETGRPVNRLNRFDIPTQKTFFGIKRFDYWLRTQKPLPLQVIALSGDGKAKYAKAILKIFRYEWETVLEKAGTRYVYRSQKSEKLMVSREVTVGTGGFSLNFTPVLSGEYLVTVASSPDEDPVTAEFYAFGYGDTESSSFEVNNEGNVTIEFDKPEYRPGDKAKILFKTPFAGKILMTVERDGVMEQKYLTTDGTGASAELEIKADYLPNVYITATAIRPMRDANIPLTVARGYASLSVKDPNTMLPVTIEAPEKSGSKTRQTIRIKTTPSAELTVAAVDEGVLQIKNYQTPDPHGFFYQKRALEVEGYDVYPRLFPERSGYASSVGGDGYDMEKRVNPLSAKRVNLVAKWSGRLKADSKGNAEFTLDVPQFSGAIRIMAAAYKGDAFGSGEKEMKVADPLVISSSLPRFVAPGDSVTAAVSIANTTDRTLSATISINVGEGFSKYLPTQSALSLPPGSERIYTYTLGVKNFTGVSHIEVKATAAGKTYTERTEMSVRPASALTKSFTAGKAGANTVLKNNREFIAGTASSKLVITSMPAPHLAGNLRDLIQYPHGCAEQTVSAAFPQLYYDEMAKALGQEKKSVPYNPDYTIAQAIRKLESMQLHNGGISYWSGGDYENVWASIYAAHFMLEAEKAGQEVSHTVLDKLLARIMSFVKSNEKEEYYYIDDDGINRAKTLAKKEIFYAMYVLAVAGKYDPATMNFYKSNEGLVPADGKFLLACTYAMMGKQTNFVSLLPGKLPAGKGTRATGGSFSSPIRDEALALNALLDAAPGHATVGTMARHLSELTKGERWMSTQEKAFVLMAFGKMAKKAASEPAKAEIKINGKAVGNFTGKDLVWNQLGADASIEIKSTGGPVYYFYETEGMPTGNEVKEEDSRITVRRSYYDRFGNAVSGRSFEQNELAVVKITLKAMAGEKTIENIAITDVLPAGLEVENPRLGGSREFEWIKTYSTPNHLDIRDDRVIIYTEASTEERVFYYAVRAVSKGTFRQGPVSADAMYNADYRSAYGAGKIEVK